VYWRKDSDFATKRPIHLIPHLILIEPFSITDDILQNATDILEGLCNSVM
jgi:hypothetical protein